MYSVEIALPSSLSQGYERIYIGYTQSIPLLDLVEDRSLRTHFMLRLRYDVTNVTLVLRCVILTDGVEEICVHWLSPTIESVLNTLFCISAFLSVNIITALFIFRLHRWISCLSGIGLIHVADMCLSQ